VTAEAYEEQNPDVGVEVVFSPGHEDNPKLLTSIAGGQAPDLAMIVDFNTAQWAELGVMQPLTEYFNAAGLKGEDFWPAAWYLMEYKGEVWQMPFNIDPNFPLFWNKGLFEESGLDPEVGPTTIDDVNQMSEAINKIEDGKVTKIGIIPWGVYGYANSIYTWGWAFGGSFFDVGNEEVTPDDDYIIAALEWMTNYAQDLGGPDQIATTPPGLQGKSFNSGNEGMSPLVIHNYRDLDKYAPDIEVGQGLLPYQPPGASALGAGAWFSGWRHVIPVGAPHPDEAWEFTNWLCATPEGTEVNWDALDFVSGWLDAPVNERIRAFPGMEIYFQVLETATHAKDPLPVGGFYQTQLEEMTPEAVYGRMTPMEAMQEVKTRTVAEWDRFREQQG
jgi:multiple sugar transport system substrate-binding protein